MMLVTLAVKSNRSLSGATSDPLWSASPRTFLRAKLRTWVAVWLLITWRRRPCNHVHTVHCSQWSGRYTR